MKQSRLLRAMLIRHQYIPMRRTGRGLRSDRRGLAEHQLRQHLEGQGWLVWRGGLFASYNDPDQYPNVQRKYEALVTLLERDHPGKIGMLRYLCAVHHGMPDLLCYRHNEWKFVECKFLHEQLSPRQKKTIVELARMGLRVEVHKLVDHRTKTRVADVDLETGVMHIREWQDRLRLTQRALR